MQLDVHRQPVAAVNRALRQAGFSIEMTVVLDPDQQILGGVMVACRTR